MNDSVALAKIPSNRRVVHYIGLTLAVTGFILFISLFLSDESSSNQVGSNFARSISNSGTTLWIQPGENPEEIRSTCGVFKFDCNANIRVVGGGTPIAKKDDQLGTCLVMASFGLMFIGGILALSGKYEKRALGVAIDRRGNREEFMPWNLAAGRMLEDEIPSFAKAQKYTGQVEMANLQTLPVIKVRCMSCNALNAEKSVSCEYCGEPLTALP